MNTDACGSGYCLPTHTQQPPNCPTTMHQVRCKLPNNRTAKCSALRCAPARGWRPPPRSSCPQQSWRQTGWWRWWCRHQPGRWCGQQPAAEGGVQGGGERGSGAGQFSFSSLGQATALNVWCRCRVRWGALFTMNRINKRSLCCVTDSHTLSPTSKLALEVLCSPGEPAWRQCSPPGPPAQPHEPPAQRSTARTAGSAPRQAMRDSALAELRSCAVATQAAACASTQKRNQLWKAAAAKAVGSQQASAHLRAEARRQRCTAQHSVAQRAHRDAVVHDLGGAVLGLEHDIAALGAQGHAHHRRQLVHARLHALQGCMGMREGLLE